METQPLVVDGGMMKTNMKDMWRVDGNKAYHRESASFVECLTPQMAGKVVFAMNMMIKLRRCIQDLDDISHFLKQLNGGK